MGQERQEHAEDAPRKPAQECTHEEQDKDTTRLGHRHVKVSHMKPKDQAKDTPRTGQALANNRPGHIKNRPVTYQRQAAIGKPRTAKDTQTNWPRMNHGQAIDMARKRKKTLQGAPRTSRSRPATLQAKGMRRIGRGHTKTRPCEAQAEDSDEQAMQMPGKGRGQAKHTLRTTR